MTNESFNDEEVAGEVEREVTKEVEEEVAKEVEERDYGPNDPNNVRRKEEMKQIFKELDELRQAGKFERTFVKEDKQGRIKIRFYKDHFALSSGKTITMDSQEMWKDGKLIGAGGGWGGGGWGGKEARTEKK